jgi:isohexenylglutaconyl-CoA hydratase
MSEREYRTLIVERHGAVLAVTLDRPRRMNAMNGRMVAELDRVAGIVEKDDDLRAVFLRGAGASFCSGADLKELRSVAGDVDALNAVSLAFGRMLLRFAQVPALVVAAAHGPVMGGGLGLACVADLTLARRGTRFAMPEITRGVAPAQILPFVVRRIGASQAARLALSGEAVRPREAVRIGLAHEVFEDESAIEARLGSVAESVRQLAPAALRSTRALLDRGLPGPDDLEISAKVFAATAAGAEAREGAAAFAESRDPAWAKS